MASRGVNKVILVGNLGQDPEVRYMPNGNAVANFTLATSESWKDQQGQQQERTEWHRCVAYRRLAEVIGEYAKKGSKLYVEGRLQTRKWQDQSGQEKFTTEIIVNEMQLLDSRGQGQGQGGYQQPQQSSGGQGWNQPQQPAAQPAAPQQGGYSPQSAPQPQQGAAQPQQGYAPQQPQQRPAPQQNPLPAPYNEPSLDFDDDIPF